MPLNPFQPIRVNINLSGFERAGDGVLDLDFLKVAESFRMKVGLIKTKGFISDPVGHSELIDLELMINDRKNNRQIMTFGFVQGGNFQWHGQAFKKSRVLSLL